MGRDEVVTVFSALGFQLLQAMCFTCSDLDLSANFEGV
jgi:hypothetical protein